MSLKQLNLFGEEFTEKQESDYTSKITTPIYEPKNKQPHPLDLFNDSKTKRLIKEIESSSVSKDEKRFLIEAARRHTVFNYSKVADYYAHASAEMQNLMERSALVIIDFEKAIQYGYVNLSKEISNLYLQEYGSSESESGNEE